MNLTLKNVASRCQTEADAYGLLEELRWHGTPICSHCGHDKAYFLTPKNGSTRATGPKRTMSPRRVYKCAKCRKQFSVLTGTIFHGTKVSLVTWLLVLVQVSSAKNGISAREVARMHEVTEETAWHMIHRIREAMRRDPLVGLLSSEVESDETWIGPKRPRAHGGWTKDKIPVVTLVDRATGEARSRVLPSVTSETLGPVLREQIASGAVLMTDGLPAYISVGPEYAEHHTVNHGKAEYARTTRNGRRAGVNRAEGFFAQFKGSLAGTFHGVSPEHLPRYLAEFDYRYSTCNMNDTQRMADIVSRTTGRRLAYRPLTNGS